MQLELPQWPLKAASALCPTFDGGGEHVLTPPSKDPEAAKPSRLQNHGAGYICGVKIRRFSPGRSSSSRSDPL